MRLALALALLVLLGFLVAADTTLVPVEPTGQIIQGGGLFAFAYALHRLGERVLDMLRQLKELGVELKVALAGVAASVRDAVDRRDRLRQRGRTRRG